MAYTFPGGIHPEEFKELTEKEKLKTIEIPKELYLPLTQHIGAPTTPVIKAKDEVEYAMKLADSDKSVSAPIHAPVNGKVKFIRRALNPNGRKLDTITLEVAENSAPPPELDTYKMNSLDIEGLNRDEALKKIREAGVVGMGGAAFPTHIKLSPPPQTKIDYVIINGCECEPYLTTDDYIMKYQSDKLVFGTKLLMKITGATEGIIAVETNKPEAIANLNKACEKYPDIKVAAVKTKYPQGAEKNLIYAVTKREVPFNGGLPFEVGTIVQNVATATSVVDAIVYDRPLTWRIVTVSGKGIKNPGNYYVPLGTTVKHLLEQAGGISEDTKRIVSGGPMMGISLSNLEVPIVKATSGILALTEDEIPEFNEQPCVSCGKCLDICAMKLCPSRMVKYYKEGNYEKADKWQVLNCVECGCCSFSCPAQIHLVHYIRLCKAEVLNLRRQQQQAS